MRKPLTVFALTLICLAALDGVVALALSEAEKRGKLGSLVRYFDYGRSVPGKLDQWQANPDMAGNLFDVAWRDQMLAASRAKFAAEPADIGPVIRSYGMSFVDNVIGAAVAARPGLHWDPHSGPGAPPNFAYAMIEDDAENRRAGDIVVFGILSSSVPALAAFSNRSWAFEQPAPFTYPIYRAEGTGRGLTRIEPVITSADAERALVDDPETARAWTRQQAAEDPFHGVENFGLTWLDRSPFMRLVRRSLATAHVRDTEAQILADEATAEVLRRMIVTFAETTRAAGQYPVVMLIQTRDPRDADLLALAGPVLRAENIPTFATAEHFDPRNAAGFRPDGHYTPEVDAEFGQRFLTLIGASVN